MTKRELMFTYNYMSMPEERVSAVENRLLGLFDKTENVPSADVCPPAQEFRAEQKKLRPASFAAGLGFTAAAVMIIFGGIWLYGKTAVPVDPNSTVTEEQTAETDETNTEREFLFTSEDIPPYENLGFYDEYGLTLTSEVSVNPLDEAWLDGVRDSLGNFCVAKMEITGVTEWNTAVFYTAQITERFAGDVPADGRVSFSLFGQFAVQQPGKPPLCEGDEIIGVVTTDRQGDNVLLKPTELMFDVFEKDGAEYAAQRFTTAPVFTANIQNLQTPDPLLRETSTTGNPVRYFGIYKTEELSESIAEVLSEAKRGSIWGEMLDISAEDFSMDFGAFEKTFSYYWLEIDGEKASEMIYFGYDEDIFGTIHGDSEYADAACKGFCEKELGWYMLTEKRGERSLYFIPKTAPENMYRYDEGKSGPLTYSDFSARYIIQGAANLCLDVQPGGGFYAAFGDNRKPVEHYVGKLSYLGALRLCEDYGEVWAEEFLRWYNVGGSFEDSGRTKLRAPLLASGEDNFGAGDVYLIDHTEDRIVAAFRFADEDWIEYRNANASQIETGGVDFSEYGGERAALYYILTAEYINGEWQESFEPLSEYDKMALEGFLTPNEYRNINNDKFYACGEKQYHALFFDGRMSELFSYNQFADKYTKLNSFSWSMYLYRDFSLYILGADTEGFIYPMRYDTTGFAAGGTSLGRDCDSVEMSLSPDGKFLIVRQAARADVLYSDDLSYAAYDIYDDESDEIVFDENGFTEIRGGKETRFDYAN